MISVISVTDGIGTNTINNTGILQSIYVFKPILKILWRHFKVLRNQCNRNKRLLFLKRCFTYRKGHWQEAEQTGKPQLHLNLKIEQDRKIKNSNAGSSKKPGIYVTYKVGAEELLGGKMGRLVCLFVISFQDWYLQSDLEKPLTLTITWSATIKDSSTATKFPELKLLNITLFLYLNIIFLHSLQKFDGSLNCSVHKYYLIERDKLIFLFFSK